MVPSGLKSTGWPAVRDKSLELGIRFDPWQDGVGRIILSKRADGHYATSVGGVVISIPRQVGKTFLFGALVFALCLLFPGLTVIWTAHRLRTAAETFSSMQAMARRRKIAPHIKQVFVGSGEEEIQFRNGSRILFGARERGFGRGFSMVDVLVFDEAQILTDNAIDDMVPATNQAPDPLLLFSGTPPKPSDPSEVFTAKRAKALAGGSADMAYVEFSADENADPNDRKQWSKANPSYPKRTSAAAILRMRENLTGDSFLREALGIWPKQAGKAAIPTQSWAACLDVESRRDSPPAFAVAVEFDRKSASIGVAAWRSDGLAHVEVVEHRSGTSWVVPRLVELKERHGDVRRVVVGGGPAGSLIGDAEGKSVPLESLPLAALKQATGAFYDEVIAGGLRHIGQQPLDAAVGAATIRKAGDAWLWGRQSSVDIAPLEAVTLARWALPAPGAGVSVYETRGVRVLG